MTTTEANPLMKGAGNTATAGNTESMMIPNTNEQPIYVSLRETRETMPGSKGRSSRGGATHHTYAIKFYLVDSLGRQHFAAVGYDGGDSHYQYTNQPEFPKLSCHNKAEVKAWADEIIRASQQSSGYRVDVVKDDVPAGATGSSISLPQFVSYSESKQDTPDGRRQIRWYLLDSLGHNHLAVIGDEKDTRDGHYVYRTESVFDKVVPMLAHNQEEVKKWLNWMIGGRQGPIPVSGGGVGGQRTRAAAGVGFSTESMNTFESDGAAGVASDAAFGVVPPSTTLLPPTLLSDRPVREVKRGRGRGRGRGASAIGIGWDGVVTTRGRGRGRGRGRPRGGAGVGMTAYGTEGVKARGAAVARRGRGAFRVYDLDMDSRMVVSSEVRKWLEEEARAREERKTFAMDFIDDQLPAYEKEILDRNVPILERVRDNIVAEKSMEHDELVVAAGALRELTHLRPTLAMISDEKITSMLKDIMENGPDALGQSSRRLLEKWLRVGTAHATVFSQAELYNQDPRLAGEALLRSPAQLDRLVTSITHRKIQTRASGSVYKPRVTANAFGGFGVGVGTGARTSSMTASGSIPLSGPDLTRATSISTGVGACGTLGSPGVASEVSDVLEDNTKIVGDDDVAILNPYQQKMSMQGIEY